MAVVTTHSNALFIRLPTLLQSKPDEQDKRKNIYRNASIYSTIFNNQSPRNTLILVSFVVEHGEGDYEENQHGINDINSEPEILHRQGEFTRAIVYRVPTRLPVGDISRQHENGNGGDGEPENDDEFGEIRLVSVVRVLVIDEEVDIEEEH